MIARGAAPRPVAVFIPSLNNVGGTERATLRYIRGWAGERPVTVYCRSVDVDLPPNVRAVRARLPNRPALVGWLAFLGWSTLRARRLRRSEHPPIIFTPGANLLGADLTVAHIFYKQYREVLQADAAGGRAITPATGLVARLRSLQQRVYYRAVEVAERRHYARSRFVLAVSEWEAAAMRASGLRVDAVAPNGVDLAEFDGERVPRSGERIRLLCVGSEIEKKGLDLLVEAVSSPSLRDRTSLTIVTRPSNEVPLRASAARWGYAGLRIITETVPASELYKDCDIYVGPSREDSFNMPALEAMASRVPVVVSTRCGLSALARETQAASIVEPSAAEVAAAVISLIDTPGLMAAQAARGYELARTCTWDVPVGVVALFLSQLDDGVPSR